MMERAYSDPDEINTEGLENFQTDSVEWAFRLKLFREGGETETHLLREGDVDGVHRRIYQDNGWDD